MPGYETTVRVSDGLSKGIAERGLCAEIHVAEEELAEEIGRDCAGLFTFAPVRFHGVVCAPVEEADGEGAEMVVGGEEGCGLGGEGGWGGGGFGECCGVGFIGNDLVKSCKGEGFAAAMGGGGRLETEFGV